MGRFAVRQWALLVAASGQFRDRLWAESHGHRHRARPSWGARI